MAGPESVTFTIEDETRFQDRLLELASSGDFDTSDVSLMMLGIARFRRFLNEDPDFYYEVYSPEAFDEGNRA